MVGGRDASFDGFNRALDAKRPIGSIAKPLVYLAALEQGTYTPATFVLDEPVELKLQNGQIWKPENFTKTTNGPVPMVRALTQSLNLATVNLGLEVGLDKVAETYVQLGLEQAPAAYPSILLGAANLSPFDVAQMYNTLANGGFRSPLRAVRAVIDENGKALKAPELEIDATAAPEAVYALDRMLIEVMDRGTGRPARKDLPEGITVAGKTGTSERLSRQLVRGFLGRSPDRRLGRSRRQQLDRADGNDRCATGLVEAHELAVDVVVRARVARGSRRTLDRLLQRRGDLSLLQRCRSAHGVRHRHAAGTECVLSAVGRPKATGR